jgi:uncharacterized protein (DUF2126 family)
VFSAADAFDIVTTRLAHDLRTRFPGIEVRVRASSDGMGCEVRDAGEPWGTVGTAQDGGPVVRIGELEGSDPS